jgi:GH24 family phage-related lysozyme (muramidase)
MNLANIKARLIRFEGSIPHMYRCTGGEVTIGVGHAIPSAEAAAKLKLVQIGDQQPASITQIRTEFKRVKKAPLGHTADWYRQHCELRLPDADIDSLLESDIASVLHQVDEHFAFLSQYPVPAQEAIFDMAFNLGLTGLLQKFPNCTQAIRRLNWTKAAMECHRNGISEERNQETKELFTQASVEAATPASQPIPASYSETVRYHAALQLIAALPERYGHFNGAAAATEAVRIAKEALGIK